MSTYLMSQADTALLAAYAESKGYVKNAHYAMSMLRSANNAALVARYGAQVTPLQGVHLSIKNAREALERGITVGGVYSPDLTVSHIKQLAREFIYQCSEGDVMDTHPGAKILTNIMGE